MTSTTSAKLVKLVSNDKEPFDEDNHELAADTASSDDDDYSSSSDISPLPLSPTNGDKVKDIMRKQKSTVKFKFVSNAQLYEGVLRRKRRAEKLNETIEERQRASDNTLDRQQLAEEARSQRTIDFIHTSADRLDAFRYLTGHVYRAAQLCDLDSKTPPTCLPTYKHILDRGFEEALRDEVTQIVLSKVKDTRKEIMDRVLNRQRQATNSLMKQGLQLVDSFLTDEDKSIYAENSYS